MFLRLLTVAALSGLLFGTAAGAAPATPPGTASGGPSEAAPFIVAIDPGHGGRDAGSRGTSLLEKDFTLRVSKLLAERLRRYPQIKVVLTRKEDTELLPAQRAAVANFNGASLFISIQADASWRPGTRGPSIFVAAPQRPPRVEGEPQEAVALRWQRGQNVHLAGSLRIAQGLKQRFDAIAPNLPTPLHALPLTTLEGARMPAVYVSLGTISTPEEEARLREMNADDPYLVALAAEVARFAGLPETPPEAAPSPPAGETPKEKPEGGEAPPSGPSPGGDN